MIQQLRFYLNHSLNDLRVNRQRTAFALLCIAAGVAAIVSLQTLAIMIENTLVGNLQESNKADIQIEAESEFVTESGVTEQGVEEGVLATEQIGFLGNSSTFYILSREGVDIVGDYLRETVGEGVEVTYRQPLSDTFSVFLGTGDGAAVTAVENGEQITQTTPIMIDPEVYPFYGALTTLGGLSLAEAMNSPIDIVISESISRALDIEVGDVVTVSGAEAEFTVTGIVTASQEIRGFTNFAAAIGSGFYYLDHAALEFFGDIAPRADVMYVRLDDPARVNEVNTALRSRFPYLETTTTDDLRETYVEVSDNIDQLVTIMGLLSLLIGGIGIINTMQVIVRRRTTEVAVLKTLGLQANQVTILFLVEAVIMGIIGSIIGVVLGWLMVFVIRGAAEAILSTPLPFVLAPAPALTGLFVGVLVTTVFGFLPTLSAGQVRPGVVLRPTDSVVPRAGLVRSLLALAIVILALSLIATPILGAFTTALAVIVGAFVAAGVLYLILSFLIWLVGRLFPSLGIPDLKISLRQMLTSRSRAAITLLALVIGVFSLSTITLFADSIQNLLRFAFEEQLAANVSITVPNENQLARVETILQESEGVNSYRVNRTFSMSVLSVEDAETGETLSRDQLAERMENTQLFPFGGPPEDEVDLNYAELLDVQLGRVDALSVENLPEASMIAGRQLTAEDSGTQGLVITDDPFIRGAGISVGDRVNFEITTGGGGGLLGGLGGGSGETQSISFEVIGVQGQGAFSTGFTSQAYTLTGAFPEGVAPATTLILADIADENIPDVRRELSGILGVFVLETAAFTRIISNLLGTFTAFPTMVAALGLIVGGVVIANSVALTTMERRREIAVMKAIGLQRERVLFMLLLENSILGFIGGLLGVGIGFVALSVLLAATGAATAIPYGSGFLLMLLCVFVALVAALTTAWGASGEKPLNVLRYE